LTKLNLLASLLLENDNEVNTYLKILYHQSNNNVTNTKQVYTQRTNMQMKFW